MNTIKTNRMKKENKLIAEAIVKALMEENIIPKGIHQPLEYLAIELIIEQLKQIA
jgi:hypothetical protein